MDKKFKIIIIIVIIAVIGIIALLSLGLFSTGPTTKFNNNFMSGSIVGNATLQPPETTSEYDKWAQSYNDKINGIQYNMSTCDNVSFLLDVMSLQNGLPKPETRKFNGVEWKIYYAQAVPTVEINEDNQTNNSKPLDVYILTCDYHNQSYLTYVVSNGTVECDGSTYCKLYTDYVAPYLESVKFKHSANAPHIYDILGLSKGDYDILVKEMAEYKAGNITEQNSTQST